MTANPAADPGVEPATPLVDGVVVINLDTRPERLERFRSQAHAIGLLPPWTRLPAVRGIDLPGYGTRPWFHGRRRDRNWAGRAGCALSHRKAIEHAQAQGWERVLILEDDVEFDAALAGFLGLYSEDLLAMQAQWDVCYLGYSRPVGPIQRIATFGDQAECYRVQGCYTTHAYILRDTTYQWLLSRLPTQDNIWPWLSRHRAVDRWYTRHLSRRFEVAAVSPTLIGQYSDFSEIGQREAGADRDQHLYHRLDAAHAVDNERQFRARQRLRELQHDTVSAWDGLRARVKRLKGF